MAKKNSTYHVEDFDTARRIGRGEADVLRGAKMVTAIQTPEGRFYTQESIESGACCPDAKNGHKCRHYWALKIFLGEVSNVTFESPELEALAKADKQVALQGGYRGQNRAPLALRHAAGMAVAAAKGEVFEPWGPNRNQ